MRLNEVLNLRLPADLLVLGACRSTLGRLERGAGLLGMTRGFMHAGAARVAAFLPELDDQATAGLMSRFYEGLLRPPRAPAAALRTARLALARTPRWRDPVYRAGFVLQGDGRQQSSGSTIPANVYVSGSGVK